MLKIRHVADQDCRLVWDWVNDPEVRASAFKSDPVSWEEHVAWFRKKKSDPNCYMYILSDEEDRPIGQVRFDVKDNERTEVDISVAENKRCKGYGVTVLRLACEFLILESNATQIVARIKPQKLASLRIFEKAGFVVRGRDWVDGSEAVLMILRREQLC